LCINGSPVKDCITVLNEAGGTNVVVTATVIVGGANVVVSVTG
jgi:hypothetical protein